MTSGSLTYRIGDATSPERDGRPVILAHVVNDRGAFGAGFALAVAKRWPQVRETYYAWHEGRRPDDARGFPADLFRLGAVLLVHAGDGVYVANMVAQHGIRGRRQTHLPAPIRYPALVDYLCTVGMHAEHLNASVVVMPRIGCGLAGGEWSVVEPMIRRHLCIAEGVDVVVYDLNERDAARYAA